MPDDRDDLIADSALVSALHDEIDAREALQEKARAIVDEVRPMFVDLVAELDDDEAALEAIALRVEDALDALTSSAAQLGYAHGSERARRFG